MRGYEVIDLREKASIGPRNILVNESLENLSMRLVTEPESKHNKLQTSDVSRVQVKK